MSHLTFAWWLLASSMLLAFAEPVVQIKEVHGCKVSISPSTLHCLLVLPAITITGGDFGLTGASVTLSGSQPSDPGLACPVVRHVIGAEAEQLVCEGIQLPSINFAPQWFAVTVTTTNGGNATLPRALLSTGQLVVTSLVALGSGQGACKQSSSQSLSDCPPTGAHFGIHGRFRVSSQSASLSVWVGPHLCPQVTTNASYVVCQGLVGSGQDNNVIVTVGSLQSQANGFTVSFMGICGRKMGFWAGVGCTICISGYYGPNCTLRCPGVGQGHGVCGGHGTCDDGVAGSGRCMCSMSEETGFWVGEACDECQSRYYGPQCVRSCLSGAFGAPGATLICSGHGTCSGGRNGTGACRCEVPYDGPACGLRCPAVGSVCSGHGICKVGLEPGYGTCHCIADAAGGYWTGDACSVCVGGWIGPNCSTPCPVSSGLVCGGHGACSHNASRGVCLCTPGHAGPSCALPCPQGPGGAPACSGHGACALRTDGTAACGCAARWAGAACETCLEGWTGRDCDVPCPLDEAGFACSGHGTCLGDGLCLCRGGYCGQNCSVAPAVCDSLACDPGFYGAGCALLCLCSSHGTCLNGPFGSGACVCSEGWVGSTCATPCEGHALPVCGGHGRCRADSGACDCDAAWRTLSVDEVCSTACPGPSTSPCSGHGNCTADARCECQPGYRGAACDTVCPTDAEGRLCGGHGECDAAGACACVAGAATGYWGGDACDACAAGWWGPECGDVCVSGVSTARECICEPSWARPNCSVQCPLGGPGIVCAGHGVCDSGKSGTGACICLAGYAGPACDFLCESSSEEPCSGHGQCRPDGSCRCQDSVAGHWAGLACDACAEDYFGTNCDLRCPRDAAGADCSGHGHCVSTSACTCYADAVQGHWEGPVCEGCAPGYYGPACRNECPGGSCQPCFGHGVCDDGLAGSGACACQSGPDVGHWASETCGECAPGYWTPQCTAECPGGAAEPCRGRGTCSDGVFGTGVCACAAGPATGWWAGEACEECRSGYYGPGCALACPSDGGGVPCTGQGVCDDGIAGTGDCACDLGYVGRACHIPCPTANGAVCNNIGVCTAPEGLCNCSNKAVGGHWGGVACEACASGWVGPQCSLLCPTDAAGRVCNNTGKCVYVADEQDSVDPRDGAAGYRAACECRHGYAGTFCNIECPGGALRPCSGHGTCSVTGQCECWGSNTSGYWTGVDCGRCRSGWSGADCQLQCARDPTGVPCAGMPCMEGQCVCTGDACGPSCNVTGRQCDSFACPPGWYGPDCADQCPQAGGGTCGGHGSCLAKVYGNGRCICALGYAGTACNVTCPVVEAGVCSGHGVCDARSGGCSCYWGYATADCSLPCPIDRDKREICAGHGVCAQGARANGTCACDAGYGAPDCGTLCPGFDPADPGGRACGGHGDCRQRTAECVCHTAPGHWAGPACEYCAVGWFGPQCEAACVHGYTNGRECWCRPGFATANCSVECPGTAFSPCTGHGACLDGHARNGSCVCDADYYGANCSQYCRPELCFAGVLHPPARAQCEPGTGRCVCQRNATGHWAGPHCNECEGGYWGVLCNQLCACSGHGVCGWLDGECSCFNGTHGNGHWAGRHCDICQTGFLEPKCTTPSVSVSRTLEIQAPTLRTDSDAAIVSDEEHHLLYLGGMPLLVFNMDDGTTVDTLDLRGIVRSGAVSGASVVLLLESPDTGKIRAVNISRGPRARVMARGLEPAGRRGGRARFQPQAEPPVGASYVRVLMARGSQHMVFFQRGALTILKEHAGSMDQVLHVPPTDLELDDVRGSVLWCRGACAPEGANASALLLVGEHWGSWQVVAFALPLTGAVHSLAAGLRLPLCAASPCTAASAAAVHGDTLYLVLEQGPGLLLAVVDVRPWLQGVPRLVRSGPLAGAAAAAAATALYYDAVTDALFVATNVPGAPSIVYKLRAESLETYGLVRLGIRGGLPEVVQALEPAPALRRLYALTEVRGQPIVITLLLSAVISVHPDLADAQGGTQVLGMAFSGHVRDRIGDGRNSPSCGKRARF